MGIKSDFSFNIPQREIDEIKDCLSGEKLNRDKKALEDLNNQILEDMGINRSKTRDSGVIAKDYIVGEYREID